MLDKLTLNTVRLSSAIERRILSGSVVEVCDAQGRSGTFLLFCKGGDIRKVGESVRLFPLISEQHPNFSLLEPSERISADFKGQSCGFFYLGDSKIKLFADLNRPISAEMQYEGDFVISHSRKLNHTKLNRLRGILNKREFPGSGGNLSTLFTMQSDIETDSSRLIQSLLRPAELSGKLLIDPRSLSSCVKLEGQLDWQGLFHERFYLIFDPLEKEILGFSDAVIDNLMKGFGLLDTTVGQYGEFVHLCSAGSEGKIALNSKLFPFSVVSSKGHRTFDATVERKDHYFRIRSEGFTHFCPDLEAYDNFMKAEFCFIMKEFGGIRGRFSVRAQNLKDLGSAGVSGVQHRELAEP